MSADVHEQPAEISVVMGTYNGARYIEEQLETILSQTFPPAEVIISDDGSTDGTLAVVEAIAARAGLPIRVHCNDRQLGFAENFLAACDLASSRLIAFSDQDDHWFADKLAVSRDELLKHDAVLCVHGVDDIDVKGAFLRHNPQRIAGHRVYAPLEANPWDVYYGFSMLFERSLLATLSRDQRGTDIYSPGKPLSHDRWIFFLATCFGRVVTLPQSLADYRQHESQLFGGAVHRSIARRILDKLSLGGDELAYLATVSNHRAELLRSLGETNTDAARAAAQWARTHAVLRTSSQLRSGRGVIRKVNLLVGNVRRGAYRSMNRGGMGLQFLLEDVAALAASPITGRLAPRPAVVHAAPAAGKAHP